MFHHRGEIPEFRDCNVHFPFDQPESSRFHEIRGHLEAILNGEVFARADRSGHLLRFLVDAVLAGESKSLNEYLIGSEVFGRPASSFDPTSDAIVRTEMGRLRRRLADYYSTEGRNLPLVIELPARSYVPVFRFRTVAVSRSGLSRRTLVWLAAAAALIAVASIISLPGMRGISARKGAAIIVLPFVDMSEHAGAENVADWLTDELIDRVALISGTHAISRTTAFSFKGKTEDLRTIGRKYNVGLVLEGTVTRTNNRLFVSARLFKTSDGYSIWSRTFERDASDIAQSCHELASSIAAALREKLISAGLISRP